MWVGAAFFGFLVWWPIGVAFLLTILASAISQQLTGYNHQQIQNENDHLRRENQTLRYNLDRPMREINPPANVPRIRDHSR